MAQGNGTPTASASASTPTSAPALQAAYEGTGPGKTFTQSLPPLLAEPTTAERTAYLGALRAAVAAMQGEVNTFLTRKMEEDKSAANGNGVKVDDAKEEENYGEEVVE